MQAARGTTALNRRAGLLFAVAAIIFATDQLTKVIAVAQMADGESIPIIDGVFHLTLRRNPGAGFSLLSNYPWVFTIVATVIAAFIVRAARRTPDRLHAIAFGLVLAGALGNLADRAFRSPSAFRGHVVDFFDLRVWPVFNVADMSIVAGAALLVFASWRAERRSEATSP